jgi:hypothetical protein
MKTYKITMKNGKCYIGNTRGAINGEVVLSRPNGGHIMVDGEESFRKTITISKSEIKNVVEIN